MDTVNNTIRHTPHYHSTLKKYREIKGSYGMNSRASLLWYNTQVLVAMAGHTLAQVDAACAPTRKLFFLVISLEPATNTKFHQDMPLSYHVHGGKIH